jgi:predicted dienelactone hydrolase
MMMSYRLRTVFILVVVLLSLSVVSAQGSTPDAVGLRPDAPPYALHGPYWVGTMELVIETEGRSLPLTVWYPALNPDGAAESVQYDIAVTTDLIPVPATGRAIRDAAVDLQKAPYPLVIFSHGFFMYREQSSFLTEHLASQGFVVFSVDHVGNSAVSVEWSVDDFARSRFEALYRRPQDISTEIDFAETATAPGGTLEGLIDVEHVAVVGHSAGGFTALAAGGAMLNRESFAVWCDQMKAMQAPLIQRGKLSPYASDVMTVQADCDSTDTKWAKVAELAGLAEVPTALWPSWGDSRVDAIASLDGPISYFGAEGAAGIHIPTLLFFGAASEYMTNLGLDGFWANLDVSQKTSVMMENAHHFVFGDSYDRYPSAFYANFWPVWSDAVWDMDRAHDLINHFTTAFLLDVLKGDKDAHAALAPDAVSFTGITYEAQGY